MGIFEIGSMVTKLISNPEKIGTVVEPPVRDFLTTIENKSGNPVGCIICMRPTDNRVCVSTVEMNDKGQIVKVINIVLLDDFIKNIMKMYKDGNK